jgi:hypothetical protein
MVYFCVRPAVEKETLDSREQSRMERFRRRLGRKTLYGVYGTDQEFETAVRKDLALVMREVAGAIKKKR